MTYPLHEKLRSLSARRDAAQDFYDFLEEENIVLARYHTHDDGCRDGEDPHACRMSASQLYGARENPADLIGKFLGIDPKALEAEKQAMLGELRKANGS